ncbi:hypothetical protein X975_15178, partial [Stegodyphus mimosarum]
MLLLDVDRSHHQVALDIATAKLGVTLRAAHFSFGTKCAIWTYVFT